MAKLQVQGLPGWQTPFTSQWLQKSCCLFLFLSRTHSWWMEIWQLIYGKDCRDLKQQANITFSVTALWNTAVNEWLLWFPWLLLDEERAEGTECNIIFFFILWYKQGIEHLRYIGINTTLKLRCSYNDAYLTWRECRKTVNQRIDYCCFETRAIQVWTCLKYLLETYFWLETFRDNLSHWYLPSRAKAEREMF